MDISKLTTGLKMAINGLRKAKAPKVDMTAIEDLNKFLNNAAAGHFGQAVAEAVNRMRVGMQAAISAEAPGAVAESVTLIEVILTNAAQDPAFLAAKSNIALRQALADLETRVAAIRAALQ